MCILTGQSLREEKKKSSSELEQQLASAEAENLTLQQKIDNLKAELQNMVYTYKCNTRYSLAEVLAGDDLFHGLYAWYIEGKLQVIILFSSLLSSILPNVLLCK